MCVVGLNGKTGVIKRFMDERMVKKEFDLIYESKGNGLVAGNGTQCM